MLSIRHSLTRGRIVAGFVILFALQLGIGAAVHQADNRLAAAMAKDADAAAIGGRLSALQMALGETRLRVSIYLRVGGVAERTAFAQSLAALDAETQRLGPRLGLFADRALPSTLGQVQVALDGVMQANEARRATTAALTGALAAVENAAAAIVQTTSRADDRAIADAGAWLEAATSPVLVAGARYTSAEQARDAELVRTGLLGARARLQAVQVAAETPPPRLRRLTAAYAAALDALGPALRIVAMTLEQRRERLADLHDAASLVVKAMGAVGDAVARDRRLRHEEMFAARATMRRIVHGAIGASLAVGAALSGLIGLERRRNAGTLRQANLRLDAALNNMLQGLCLYDEEHRLQVCNSRYRAIFGLAPAQTRPGMSFHEMIELAATAQGLYGNVEESHRTQLAAIEAGAPGTITWRVRPDLAVSIAHKRTSGGGWVVTYEDITERLSSEARIVHMAHHDALTNLPNRVLLRIRLDHALAQVRRGGQLAVLYLDLDNFKLVNDTLGHPVGDALLQRVAGRLLGSVREGNTVARLGGDEFAVLQLGLGRPEDAHALAARIIEAMSEPFDLDGQRITADLSIGVTVAPADGVDADKLLKNADVALYRAKAEGRRTYRFFRPEMDAQLQARRALELDLRRALTNREFELHYQPLVALGSGRISGFEALLRWRHPDRGLVVPGNFIPLAEETGLIVPIGEWVLREACATAASWPEWSEDVRVAVNLSAVQFASPNLEEMVIDALERSGLAPNRLELEITESVLLQTGDGTVGALHRLREFGVRVCMDDFGTGYSSLSYLRSFPFDKIKIDRSFIGDLSDRGQTAAIIRAIADLATGLGISVTAEGVETQEQLALVRAEGCTEVQGYLTGRPVAAPEVPGLLSNHRRMAWRRPMPALPLPAPTAGKALAG